MVRVVYGLIDTKGTAHVIQVCDYSEREHVTRGIYKDSVISIRDFVTAISFNFDVLFGYLDFIVDGKKVKTLFYDDVIGYHDGKKKI